jgi:tetratricopeptide (TPR) repeat protein
VANSDSYYIVGTAKEKETLSDLFHLLELETKGGEEQFAVVREIGNELLRLEDYGRLTNFLTEWVDKHPEDPYDGYLLLMTAYTYLKEDAKPVAALYFNRIVKNYPDLMVQGQSIHLACLNKLIELVNKPEQRIWYYQELIARFPDKIDLGVAYFMLAQSYEQIGAWDAAIQTYTKFLPYYNSSIPGFPDAFGYAKKIVDFYNSPKDWSFETLDDLVKAIQSALDAGSSKLLNKYRAKVNFFAMSWEQENSDTTNMTEFNFSDFMSGNRIRYSPTVDSSSNANEAYLKTWGWSQRISTWYLYFRKINFPADPEIHGRWEWAGVYYGEKF